MESYIITKLKQTELLSSELQQLMRCCSPLLKQLLSGHLDSNDDKISTLREKLRSIPPATKPTSKSTPPATKLLPRATKPTLSATKPISPATKPTPAATDSPLEPPTKSIKLSLECWEQSPTHVVLSLAATDVCRSHRRLVTCTFTRNSVRLNVGPLDGNSYAYAVKNLISEIIPADSKWRLKKGSILLFLAKRNRDLEWTRLTVPKKNRVSLVSTPMTDEVAENKLLDCIIATFHLQFQPKRTKRFLIEQSGSFTVYDRPSAGQAAFKFARVFPKLVTFEHRPGSDLVDSKVWRSLMEVVVQLPCVVIIANLDSYYSPVNHNQDYKRLKHILASNKARCGIVGFIGYLSGKAVSELPSSIYMLCLAIKNSSDAAVVAGVDRKLCLLGVSIQRGVLVSVLSELPKAFVVKVTFCRLTDADIEWLVEALKKLLGKIQRLHVTVQLWSCELTWLGTVAAAGAVGSNVCASLIELNIINDRVNSNSEKEHLTATLATGVKLMWDENCVPYYSP